MANLQVGIIGTSIRVTIRDQDGTVVDLSTTSTRQLYLKKPEPIGSTLIKTASLVGGGTGGIMEYLTISGDIDTPGKWQLQAAYVNSAGTWRTNVVDLPVLPNLV